MNGIWLHLFSPKCDNNESNIPKPKYQLIDPSVCERWEKRLASNIIIRIIIESDHNSIDRTPYSSRL